MDLDLPVSASSVHLLTRLGAERGLPPADCLRGTGIGEKVLTDPLAEVTIRQEYAVMRNLLAHVRDQPGFGVEAGRRYHLAMHGIWGLLMVTGKDLREAVDIAMRYLELAWAFTTITLREEEGQAVLVVADAGIPEDVRPFLVERITAASKVILGEILGSELPFTRVRFRHPAPTDTSRYVALFSVEPEFGAAENSVAFDASYLDVPLPQGNEWSRLGFERICGELLSKRRARTGTAGEVRTQLLRQPGRIPDVEEMAAELRMSSRTLCRRLQDEGTSYRRLVDEVREALAEEMLCKAQLTTVQVAGRLGYAEPASFVRAFKRWKGTTPQAFRVQSTAG